MVERKASTLWSALSSMDWEVVIRDDLIAYGVGFVAGRAPAPKVLIPKTFRQGSGPNVAGGSSL